MLTHNIGVLKNARRINKATFTSPDLTGSMALTLDTAGAFWDKVRDISVLFKTVQMRQTDAVKVYSNELTIPTDDRDFLVPGTPGTDPGDTGTAGDAQREFVLNEAVGIFSIAWDAMKDTIEGDAFLDHILQLLAIKVQNGLEYAWINGVKVGTANSQRGRLSGCYDGWLQQINDGGTVIYATDYSDRYVDPDGSANDKHLAMVNALDDKYSGDDLVWLTSRSLNAYLASRLGQRETTLGDAYVENGLRIGARYLGYESLNIPKIRKTHLVKGTGVKEASSPGATTLASIAKARQAVLGLTSASNFGDTDKVVIGAESSAATAFKLHAENRVQTGAPSGSNVTVTSALDFDHAAGENVVEMSTAPTADGIPMILTPLQNLGGIVQRNIELYTQQNIRKRCLDIVFTMYGLPYVLNPEEAVLCRDMKAG